MQDNASIMTAVKEMFTLFEQNAENLDVKLVNCEAIFTAANRAIHVEPRMHQIKFLFRQEAGKRIVPWTKSACVSSDLPLHERTRKHSSTSIIDMPRTYYGVRFHAAYETIHELSIGYTDSRDRILPTWLTNHMGSGVVCWGGAGGAIRDAAKAFDGETLFENTLGFITAWNNNPLYDDSLSYCNHGFVRFIQMITGKEFYEPYNSTLQRYMYPGENTAPIGTESVLTFNPIHLINILDEVNIDWDEIYEKYAQAKKAMGDPITSPQTSIVLFREYDAVRNQYSDLGKLLGGLRDRHSSFAELPKELFQI